MADYNAWLEPIEEAKKRRVKAWIFEGKPLAEAHALRHRRAIVETLERSMREDPSVTEHLYLSIREDEDWGEEGYRISIDQDLLIEAQTSIGLFYGVSELDRRLRSGTLDLSSTQTWVQKPQLRRRVVNHWDNMDGSIERGYAGRSFFFDRGEILVNERTRDYARMLGSLGINRCCINNVNVNHRATYLITERDAEKLRALFEILMDYGVRPMLSVNYASPIELGELTTADPRDPEVIAWWEAKARELQETLPDLAGIVIKADSEGRPGPFTYGRDQAEGANLLGRAFGTYFPGCEVYWRAFVYNAQQDWRDHTTDRARAAFDYFAPLDGQFDSQVLLQIKNGPMDFQVREPLQPLFSVMESTRLALECQAAQEYTGHAIDLCYLAPQWRQYLDWETERRSGADPVKGPKLHEQLDTFVTVSNTGNDPNWFGHPWAGANLYAFGRLAWDATLAPEAILVEWLPQTYPRIGELEAMVQTMMLDSWTMYERYTAPLGIGWMVQPQLHYGPSVDGYEYDRWGTYHRADREAIGVERGDPAVYPESTGFAMLYPECYQRLYGTAESCPDELLLFFHRVRYDHRLHSGLTVIQHIYDTHFEGLAWVEAQLEAIEAQEEGLRHALGEASFETLLVRMRRQRRNAREWCDQVNSYFYRMSGIGDSQGRSIY